MPLSLGHINRSLTAKLVIAISLFVLFGSGLIWLKSILGQRRALMQDALAQGDTPALQRSVAELSDLIYYLES